jgi:hypothetical protein
MVGKVYYDPNTIVYNCYLCIRYLIVVTLEITLPGVIWYFEPHGKLTRDQFYDTCITVLFDKSSSGILKYVFWVIFYTLDLLYYFKKYENTSTFSFF